MINRYQSLSIVVLFVSVSGPGLWSFSIPTRHWLWFFRLRLPVLFQQKVCILSESRSSWFNHVQFMSCCFLSALFRWLPYVAHGFSADVGPGELRNHVFLLRFFEWWIAVGLGVHRMRGSWYRCVFVQGRPEGHVCWARSDSWGLKNLKISSDRRSCWWMLMFIDVHSRGTRRHFSPSVYIRFYIVRSIRWMKNTFQTTRNNVKLP